MTGAGVVAEALVAGVGAGCATVEAADSATQVRVDHGWCAALVYGSVGRSGSVGMVVVDDSVFVFVLVRVAFVVCDVVVVVVECDSAAFALVRTSVPARVSRRRREEGSREIGQTRAATRQTRDDEASH